MESPIARVRREKNLTNTQISIVCGTDGSKISQIDGGHCRTMNGKVLDGLEALGYDRNELIQAYSDWRAHLAQQIIAQVAMA